MGQIDVQKSKGPTKRSSPTAGGANPRLTPVIGTVKNTVDPERMGKIWVYISDNSGRDPENIDNWRQVRFLSPFFGITRPDAPNQGYGTFKGNPTSYGMWMAPPDIGTKVLCLFVDGDMNYGFYIGCIPETEALQMVPAIGATDNIVPNDGEANSYGGALRLPVTNINTNNKATADSPDYIKAPKPVHSYSAAIMFQQGILRDPIRGPITSSSQRETPSRVGWGVSTPGRPIYEGGFDDAAIADNLTPDKAKDLRVVSRRGGHTIVMDDGDIIGRDRLIRIRSAQGHQILMSDDGQTLMVLHSNGQSYIELGKEGTVDIYSTNSINLRTQGDLNLHADNNVNIHATKDLNIQGENIHINSEKDFKHRAGGDYSTFTNGKYTNKVNGVYAVSSGGEASMVSAAIAYINGSKINLNSGQSGTKPAEVPAIDKILHTDTLFDKEKGFLAAPAKLQSITSRAPAHAPWSNAGQGVDVKTDLSADSQLPAAPSQSVQDTNTVANNNLTNPTSSAVMASTPQVGAASAALNNKVTQALTATAASDAKDSLFKDALTKGTAIAITADGIKAAAGSVIPQTANQMETSGFIKPGSAGLVNSLAAKTGNAKLAFSSTVFTTGDLNSFVKNPVAQTSSMATTLQVAQTKLQNAGAITGLETASQIGGLVYSAAKNGLGPTLDTVKSSALGSIKNSVISGVTSGALGALGDIAKGNFSAAVASGAKGALSGLTNSLNSLKDKVLSAADAAKGVAAGAFAAIKNSLKPLKAGIPQNLKAIAKKAAEQTDTAGASAATNELSQTVNATTDKSVASTLGKAIDAGGKSMASTIASGLSSLPGGASAASSIVNLSKTGLPTLPGTGDLKNAMAGLATSTINNLPSGLSNAFNVGLTSKFGGGLGSALGGSLGGSLGGDLGSTIGKGLTGAASALTSSLKTNSLTSVLSKGLPAGLGAQLQNSLSSVAAPDSGLKVPSVAVDTTDRSSIASATTGQLGDPKIPAPDFSGTGPTPEAEDKIATLKEKYDKAQEDYVAAYLALEKQRLAVLKSGDNYRNTLTKLGLIEGEGIGIPEVDAGAAAVAAEIKIYDELEKKETATRDVVRALSEQVTASPTPEG